MGIRRRYIALVATLLFILLMLAGHFYNRNSNPNSSFEKYYEYVVLLVQIILMRVVYVTKNDDTKNIATGMTVIITVVYMISFFYSLLAN